LNWLWILFASLVVVAIASGIVSFVIIKKRNAKRSDDADTVSKDKDTK